MVFIHILHNQFIDCFTVYIGMYTHKLNPSNDYVLIETAPGWELIKQLIKEGKEKCYDIWDLQ